MTPLTLAVLSWLAGCWQSQAGEVTTYEHWMAPAGGRMVGVNHVVSKGRSAGYEFLRIEDVDGKLVYIANPSGQEEASFHEVELTDSLAAFENPSHDFPQRIVYRLLADGSVMARVEGKQGEEHRVIEFPLERVPCPGASEP